MPIYLFSNPKDENEIIEIIMSVHDNHEYFKDGIKWDRVFTKPTAAIDTKWDPNSKKDFAAKTGSKKGTLGDMIDKSRELSEVRKNKEGSDSVQKDYFKKYSDERGGKTHIDERKQKAKEITKDIMVKFKSKLK